VRTAIDGNVLSALWSKEPLSSRSAESLGHAKLEGGLVISVAVYAELLAHPQATDSFVNDFLVETGIDIDFDLGQEVWLQAGRRFARYTRRRKRTPGENPKRLLADFIIGSHALEQADQLMTLDPKRYERDFPELRLISAD
jgi:hypothetical protein